MKQTAVEWLQGGLELIMSHEKQMQAIGLFEQAKEMEKQQIIDAYNEVYKHTGEQYYNKEYKTNKI